MESLFVYGTLKKPDIQKEVFGRIIKGIPDILEGYALSKVKIQGETFPILVRKPGSAVSGIVLSVSSKELALADEYETDAYQRRKLVLKTGKKAWVYCK